MSALTTIALTMFRDGNGYGKNKPHGHRIAAA